MNKNRSFLLTHRTVCNISRAYTPPPPPQRNGLSQVIACSYIDCD